MQFLVLIHNNSDSAPAQEEWESFFQSKEIRPFFKGGSSIRNRKIKGGKPVSDTSQSVGGYMRFDAESYEELEAILELHPVCKHGGTLEVFEMPRE